MIIVAVSEECFFAVVPMFALLVRLDICLREFSQYGCSLFHGVQTSFWMASNLSHCWLLSNHVGGS